MQHRYVALDGLRGVAALLVLCHHLQGQMTQSGPFSRGFLAVDFFFILSGFVIAGAYEHRLANGMSLGDFVKVRFLRLYPMMFIGTLMAAGFAIIRDQAVGFTIAAFVGQLLLIPGLAANGTLFALNSAYWSLLFEAVANTSHALSLRWLTTRRLAAWTAIAAVGIVFTAMRMHHLGGGWSVHNWWAGLVRVGFSYPLGVLIYRLYSAERLPTVTLPFPILVIGLVTGIAAASWVGAWWSDAATALFFFPALLIAGIRSPVGIGAPIATWLGAISYPLYAIHSPLVEVWGRYAPHDLLSALGAFALCVALAGIVERWVERGARKWLTAVVIPSTRTQPVNV